MKYKRQACWTFGANLPGVINRDREGKICLDIKGGLESNPHKLSAER